jgi:hypothetical protein
MGRMPPRDSPILTREDILSMKRIPSSLIMILVFLFNTGFKI